MTTNNPEDHFSDEPARMPEFPPEIPAESSDAGRRSRKAERFMERYRARRLGYELPMTSDEAATYLGVKNSRTIQRWAREGNVPAHPISGAVRRTWIFYRSELDEWLHGRVNSQHHPCPPNRKDQVN